VAIAKGLCPSNWRSWNRSTENWHIGYYFWQFTDPTYLKITANQWKFVIPMLVCLKHEFNLSRIERILLPAVMEFVGPHCSGLGSKRPQLIFMDTLPPQELF
jgi:hypothetical protein